MSHVAFVAVLVLIVFAGVSLAGQEGARDVWLDVDPATGFFVVDDGLMMIQAFHSPEVRVRGVSVVFGNTSLDYAVNAAHNLVTAFGPGGLTVHAGAASAEDLGKATDAVEAMAAALEEGPMTILAMGPVTNVATLLDRHPQLHERIESIVVVAGRRPGQEFIDTDVQAEQGSFPPDANFENDVAAMRVLLEAQVPLVLAPWEVASHVWLTDEDFELLRQTGATGLFVHATSQHWLRGAAQRRGRAAFHPYDSMALGWVTHPQMFRSMRGRASIEEGPSPRDPQKSRPLLHVRPAEGEAGRTVTYLYEPTEAFKDVLLRRLAGPGIQR